MRTSYVPPEVERFIEANGLDAVDNGKAIRRVCHRATRKPAPTAARIIYQETGIDLDPDYVPGLDDGCEPPEARNQD
jgi:hypothetical protein